MKVSTRLSLAEYSLYSGFVVLTHAAGVEYSFSVSFAATLFCGPLLMSCVVAVKLGGLHRWARCDLVCLVYVMSTVWNFFINSDMFPLLILQTGCKT